MTHDYKRNGTTTLFAALNVLDGKVIGQCQQQPHPCRVAEVPAPDRPPHAQGQDAAFDRRQLRHAQAPGRQDWLEKHPRFNMHFTPTWASWLNMVERFFRDITTKRLRRGVFTSVPELEAAINEYIALHNAKPKPF